MGSFSLDGFFLLNIVEIDLVLQLHVIVCARPAIIKSTKLNITTVNS